jgi:hypothetical protein
MGTWKYLLRSMETFQWAIVFQPCQSQEQTHMPKWVLWFIFNLQIKKNGINYTRIHTVIIILNHRT